jgi:hypothetical protein
MRYNLGQFLDGNAHFIEIDRRSSDGEIIETIPFALIPLNLLSEQEIERIHEIRRSYCQD